MIAREKRPEDQRSVRLRLTDAGTELRNRAEGVPDTIAEVMALQTKEFTILKDSLEHLSDNVAKRLL